MAADKRYFRKLINEDKTISVMIKTMETHTEVLRDLCRKVETLEQRLDDMASK